MREPGCFDAETLLAAVGHAVIATDATGVVGYWNAAAERLYGWRAEEVVGRDVGEFFVPALPAELREETRQALHAGRAWAGWFVASRKDGGLVPVAVVDTGVYDEEGNLLAVVGASMSISFALRPLLERSSDAALVLGPDAVVRYASPAVEHLLGWRQVDVVGAPVGPLLHEEDRAALVGLIDHVLSTPGAHPPVELRVRGSQGWVWCEVGLTNLLDDPALRGVVWHLRPSVQRAAREQAEERAAQLQTALDTRLVIERAKGFLAGRDRIDPEEAFVRLRGYARRHHLSLHGVCDRVLSGELEVGEK